MKIEKLLQKTDIKIREKADCIYCGENFIITDLEQDLLEKHRFKNPEHCPTCNFKILNSYFNDKHLYHRVDSQTWKKIVSIYSPEYDWKVIEANNYKKFILDDWWFFFKKEISDDIFKDFAELNKIFPKPSRFIYSWLENADFSSHVGWAKNLYLSYCVFTDCENIFHSFRVLGWCRNVFSSYNIVWSSNVYNSRNIWDSHNISFSDTIKNWSNILYSRDMVSCNDCIFSCNQINSKYKIFNKQYSKEEYLILEKEIINKLNWNQKNELISNYEKFLKSEFIEETISMNNNEKVVSDTVYDSKNSFNCFTWNWLENCINVMTSWDKSDDTIINVINSVESGVNCENAIWSNSFWVNLYNIFFSFSISLECKNIYYSADLETCEEMMFCVWLKNKKYCILNKQYEKEKYFELKEKVIDKLVSENKWWNTLGLEFKNFPYNDTLSYDYFKINKIINFDKSETIVDKNAIWTITILEDKFLSDAILDLWWKEKIKIKFRTKNKEINIPENASTIKTDELPEISKADKSILDKVIICEESGRPFRIIEQELDFLKKKWFPLPRIHHELRIEKLVNSRPFGELFSQKCDKCWEDNPSVFKEKPDYKLYCEWCYKDFMFK